MKITFDNLSKIEWNSINFETVNGFETLVLICKTVEQSETLFLLLKHNNYKIIFEKENGVGCFVLLFDEYEVGFEPKNNFSYIDKLKDPNVTKVTTAYTDENGTIKLNIEILELKRPDFNLN